MPICLKSRRNGAAAARIACAPRKTVLGHFDAAATRSRVVLSQVDGDDTGLWMRRWRRLLVTAGVFACAGGGERGVSHYRVKASV
jgi:hypothetical protein